MFDQIHALVPTDWLTDQVFLPFCVLWWAITNRYAGMESGNRYVGALLFGAVMTVLLPFEQIGTIWTLSLSYIVWRSMGWHKSIDMGRDAQSLPRDYLIFSLILLVLLVPVWIVTRSWQYVAIVGIGAPMGYVFAMRVLLPEKQHMKRIAIGEILAGAAIGYGAYSVLT